MFVGYCSSNMNHYWVKAICFLTKMQLIHKHLVWKDLQCDCEKLLITKTGNNIIILFRENS